RARSALTTRIPTGTHEPRPGPSPWAVCLDRAASFGRASVRGSGIAKFGSENRLCYRLALMSRARTRRTRRKTGRARRPVVKARASRRLQGSKPRGPKAHGQKRRSQKARRQKARSPRVRLPRPAPAELLLLELAKQLVELTRDVEPARALS